MAYDKKIKQLVIAYKDSGHTFAQVQEAFGVGSKRYYAWKNIQAYICSEYAVVGGGLRSSLMAIHKRLAELKITCKKTFTYSEKSEKNVRSI